MITEFKSYDLWFFISNSIMNKTKIKSNSSIYGILKYPITTNRNFVSVDEVHLLIKAMRSRDAVLVK